MVQEINEIEPPVERKPAKGALPETLQTLERLSWNYWWSWAPDGTSVFRDLDSGVWNECEHNPRRLLSEVSEYDLARMATDPGYIVRVRQLEERFDSYMSPGARKWATEHVPEITHQNPVAYFCAEFGIHHSLPLYSGGLGILAGDHLKSASDLGLPLVAIGLLYHHGYFRQRLRRDGWQEETYHQIDVEDLPLQLVRDGAGEPINFDLTLRGREVRVQAWRVDVGRIPLYLLDTNVEGNHEIDRMISGHLYGGDRETRCVQEMVLGIGGVRLLRRLADRAARLSLERRPLGLPHARTRTRVDGGREDLRGGGERRARALRVHDAHARRRRA